MLHADGQTLYVMPRKLPRDNILMTDQSNLDLKTLTPDGYDAVLGDIPAAARRLGENGARAITLMGTSLSFFKGAEFNQKLAETISQASGLPAVTMSTAVTEGLRAMNVRRLAVATAYNDDVNSRLRGFLEESGFEVLAMKGLGIVQIAGVNNVEQRDLLRFCIGVFRTAPEADGMLVSCGGLRTLEILAEAREQTGMPVVTEVMSPEQVPLVAKYADVLQIGARNMQNFDLLKEVGRVDVPVILKRGMSATVNEWLMAAEYIAAGGNHKIILCERGIRTFETAYRNVLDVTAVAVLKKETHLPVIVDPSHAGGKAWMVPALSCAAVAAGADGLLVEVHPNPPDAWCDADQALTPAEFALLMDRLDAVAHAMGRGLARRAPAAREAALA